MNLNISNLISVASKKYHRLILVVGLPFSGKTRVLEEFRVEADAVYINIGLELSEGLLDYASDKRKNVLFTLFNKVVENQEGKVLLFDNIEVLFDPDLDVNVLDLFLKASRHRVCVVAWSGVVVDGVLRFGEPGFWGYRSYSIGDVVVIDLNGECDEV